MTYPFDIEEARRIQKGESESIVITMEGNEFMVAQIDEEGDFPIMGIIIYPNGSQKIMRYTAKGMKRPVARSKDDLLIYTEKRYDDGLIVFEKGMENKFADYIIDRDRNKVKILQRRIFRNDLVNGKSDQNILCLATTKEGVVPFVCDYNGMRDGNQILFIKKN